jgi:glutamate-ammonia-ligase adenylyltransferase
MTADEALIAAGSAVAEAAEPVAAWLAPVPGEELATGLDTSADPVAALHWLVRLLEAAPSSVEPGRVGPLLRLLGGSPALAGTLVAEGAGWPALVEEVLDIRARDAAAHRAALAARVPHAVPRAALQSALRRYRRREFLRIGGRDLLGLAAVDETVRELSALAEGVIAFAVARTRERLAGEWGEPTVDGQPVAFVGLGMGKLGGGELNYSSDVDLVWVYERDGDLGGGRTFAQFFSRLAEEVTRALGEVTEEGFCFRVDLRLRPGGGEGPLAISIPAALSYYEAWGQTWERAVWLKARPIAGDPALGDALLAELAPFVYRRYLDFATLEDLKAMKLRVDAALRAPEAAERDVKLGRGGIREIEFLVQAQQLIHGGKDARLRPRSTLGALAALASASYVDVVLAGDLADAYRFLRDVEHKLQVVHERQTHLLPRDPDDTRLLARRLGFLAPDGAALLGAALARHRGRVREAFDALFHAAAEERRRGAAPELALLVEELDDDSRALWRLGELGFRDLEGAYRDLRLLRDGPPHAPASPRRRQALATLAPALLAEIARSAAPDRALHHMASFVSTIGARTSYLHLLLENPGVLRLLVRLFATSEFLSAFFLRHPELLDSLVRADLVRLVRSREAFVTELQDRLAAASDLEAELDTIRRFRHEEFLRIGIHDIQGDLTPDEVAHQLTWLAEACLGAAVSIGRREAAGRLGLPLDLPTGRLAVVALGKLGSEELTYASDLDLIFVYDVTDPAWWNDRPTPQEFFSRVAQRALSVLQTATREGIAYRIDTRLRPSGNQGPLVSSLEAFARYHEESAQVWERQALIRARVLSAPAELQERVAGVLERFVYGRGLRADETDEIARMRDRIEHERSPADAAAIAIKTGRGGLVDVEFVVQMLQLRHGGGDPRLRVRAVLPSLEALEGAGVLSAGEGRALREGYVFLRRLESRLRLERNQAVEAVEGDPEGLLGLARQLGYGGNDTDAVAALETDLARHREGIRAAYEQQFAAAARESPRHDGLD